MKNVATISNITFDIPVFGDHVLIIVTLTLDHKNSAKTNAMKRNWKNYSKEKLIVGLSPRVDLLKAISCVVPVVQEYWNALENHLVGVIDEYLTHMTNPTIKNLINQKKRDSFGLIK